MDGYGRKTRGLQDRLRGAAEASWVGSIPIHPRQIPDFWDALTAELTTKPPAII